ncbi:transcriptional regulator [Leptospira kobayashii]|uniref:Transcriptional regulator n=1 Tax=Leptospira kobayashii TaxID=1917830 RepID=A0ABM7UF22_9LEPT|nr:helix-turn-helix domain-containing protein [Leptospira kobayashii]BDA77081.1 transcriptional regulator [Leptospira kobayashii]
MSSKRNEENWITASSDIKKLKEQWIHSSQTKIPLLIIGESGVGKSFWIEQSIQIRKIQTNEVKIVDFHSHPASLEEIKNLLKAQKTKVIWLKNLAYAEIETIKDWLNWWKEEKYNKDPKYYFYWELAKDEIPLLKEKPLAQEFFDQLRSFRFELPPLSKRKPDIALFLQNFLEMANTDFKKKVLSFEEKFIPFFLDRNYKTNLHELKDLVFSMVAFTSTKHVLLKSLPLHYFISDTEKLHVQTGVSISDYEKEIIKSNLILTNGNREKTAKILGISERNLYRKLKEYQLEEVC